MTFYAAAALINAITSLILGTLVFLKTRKNKTTYTFCLLSLAVFVWSIFYFFWQISTTHDVALLYTRLLPSVQFSFPSSICTGFSLFWI
jgi:glucose dehydrogenase